MSPWKAVGSVIAGAIATVVLVALTIVMLPFLGFATAEIVGNWLPLWVFALPLAACPTVGGVITGVFHGGDRLRCAMFGSLAAALGGTVIGLVGGLVFLVLLLGMVPAHGQEVDISTTARWMAALGAGVGFISCAVFGAIGGVGGHIGRRELGE